MRSIIATLFAAATFAGMAAEPVMIQVSANQRMGRIEPMLYGQFIEHLVHKRGLRHSGLARSFPVMAGSYTWSIRSKDPVSAATLICSFRQSANLAKSK
jgi:hypothetical protein